MQILSGETVPLASPCHCACHSSFLFKTAQGYCPSIQALSLEYLQLIFSPFQLISVQNILRKFPHCDHLSGDSGTVILLNNHAHKFYIHHMQNWDISVASDGLLIA